MSEIPFPYVSVNQFEKSIRAPLGRTWNPETVHRQLIKPKVVTQLGHIITPMDKTEAFKDKDEKEQTEENGKEKNNFKRSKMGNKKHKGKSKGKRK